MANMISPPMPPAEATATSEITHRSTIASPVRIVWELADANPGMRRCDVIRLAEAAGIATYTARTQYQRWFTFRKAERAGSRVP